MFELESLLGKGFLSSAYTVPNAGGPDQLVPEEQSKTLSNPTKNPSRAGAMIEACLVLISYLNPNTNSR